MPDLGAAADETIGQRIRRLRLERGLSQRELAEPGISYAYLSRIEAGQRAPSLKALRIVARKLGVTPEHLETGASVSLAAARELRATEAELRLRLDEDPSRAEATFRELVDDARAEGELALEVRARIGVGLARARRGELREAIFHLELAFSTDTLSPLARPEAYETLARCYASSGSADRAVELLEGALAEIERTAPDEGVTAARLAGLRAAILTRNGDAEPARESLDEALERANTAWEPTARATLYSSLAESAAAEANVARTLALRRRALGLLESADDVREVARAHVLSSDLLLGEGRAEEAGPHLASAERLLALGGDRVDTGRMRTRQARRAVETGEVAEAQELARLAVDLLEEHPAEQGEALHALAAAEAAAGDLQKAEASFRRAIDQLAGGRCWRDAANAARDWAARLRAAGRTEEALEVMDQATMLSIRGMGAEARRNRS
ncbi:MAG TPA: helix-turn-helix domain-containing protein [Gaiellaceae bacterium]